MSIELTDDQLQVFAGTARDALARSVQQVAQLRKGFPKITDADIQAMMVRVEQEPNPAGEVDVAAYYLAVHMHACRNAQAMLDVLTSDGTPATLQYLFLLVLSCANIVNALTLLQAGGGLARQLHIEEAQRMERVATARAGAEESHARTNEAKAWVQDEWIKHRENHENNKSNFAKLYITEVLNKFQVTVKPRTIAEVWLSPAALNH